MAGVAVSLHLTEMHEKNYNKCLNSDPKNYKNLGNFSPLLWHGKVTLGLNYDTAYAWKSA